MLKQPTNEITSRFKMPTNGRYIRSCVRKGNLEKAFLHLGQIELTLDMIATFGKDTVWNTEEVQEFVAHWRRRVMEIHNEQQAKIAEEQAKKERHEAFVAEMRGYVEMCRPYIMALKNEEK